MDALDLTVDDMMEALDHASKALFKFKGFDIDTEDGLKGAAEWLKTATWTDAFFSESAPEDYPEELNEIDKFIGSMRLGLMHDLVKRKLAERGV